MGADFSLPVPEQADARFALAQNFGRKDDTGKPMLI
jgi:hypothetical protein